MLDCYFNLRKGLISKHKTPSYRNNCKTGAYNGNKYFVNIARILFKKL